MNDPLEFCTSRQMQSVRELITKVAGTNVTVLMRGESGVGKEVVARAIHHASPRAGKALLKINCAAMPGELLESELFGHQRGAFTGAERDKPGKFEVAHGGTLLLDEIGEMPLRLQAKLLHVLQDGEFSRVGGQRIIASDVRVIAATNRDLEAGIRAGQFREDLYYRLNVVEICLPPLRERREEIPALVGHFMKRFKKEYGSAMDLPAETLRAFMGYAWPGNVRELENVLKRIVVLGDAHHVPQEIVASLAGGSTTFLPPVSTAPAATAARGTMGLKEIARQAARDAERIAIKDVLERVHWNRTKAARLLQISYKALLYKIADCGLASPATDTHEELAAGAA
jgi:two-component system response regulator AtoC